MFYCLLFFAIFNFSLKALPLDSILKANDTVSLKRLAQHYNQKIFLEKLCKKQKERGKIPKACYKLSLNADLWCLNLKLEDPRLLKSLEKALKSKLLSQKCKEHLQERKKILTYRQSDFLLPELKNYFAVEKPFF
ncbi:MAG: hypothetical protein OXJ52_08635 [Oligoflexia bacterium]|nr:hypothetical protein [Oligoflexia bacterium]